ncbi:MAG: 50S ribosomal protein L21 [Gammaproteobacteria bacterium]
MYAIIEEGGKQYKVAEGHTFRTEKLAAETGSELKLARVLMLVDNGTVRTGSPHIEGALVMVRVEGHGRHEKIKIIKFKRRKHHRKRMGHRQYFTELRVTQISVSE